ncbi:MAG: SIMPL domain-containing protein [Selenomonadaceae bacterium]|nr:SIMPL domain-containing protein [Selenomonadaceae bacterium]
MKKFYLLTLLLVTICATTFAAENPLPPPTISVNGEGFVEVAPDRAIISLGVVTRDKNSAAVQSANAKAANSVINSIVALGIERKNISTGNYSFYPTYKHSDNGRSEITGYEATNSVTIIVDDLNLVGKIIDAALSHGANRVDNLNFGLRDKNSARDEALKLAILDARHTAEVAAAALGKTIVGVRNVMINSSSVSSPRNAKLARAMEDSINAETPIESGTVQCSASVHVEFEIR